MTVVNLVIVTGNDQGQQAGDAGAVSLGASTVSIRNNSLDSTRRHLGLRFAVTSIPQGSTINSATLKLTSAHGSVDDLRCDVYGHDVDASDSFETSSGDPTVFQRTRTAATVNWVEANCALNATQSISVTSIIQEIVDRGAWAETEITMLCIGSPSFSDNYQAYGIGGTTPPALDIDFTEPAGISGTLSVTLGSLSLSSEGSVGTFSIGTLDQTLGSLALVSAGTVETVGGPAVPTITPNTADAHAFGADTTPAIEFTGDDTDAGETLRYNIQISESNTFPTTAVLTKQNVATDMGTVHANNISGPGTEDDRPGNSFLGNGGVLDSIHLKLGIQGTPVGNYYLKIYEVQGTFGTDAEPLNAADAANTPTPGYIAISDGFAVPGDLTTSGIEKTITFSGANRIVLESGHAYYFILNYIGTGDASNAPFCSVSTAHTYEGDCYNDGQSAANNGYEPDWEVWFKLYEAPFLLDKVSNVDTGFLNTVDAGNLDPFTKNQKISYTVQAGEALASNTYYWRARAIDPFGSNTYSSWTTVRSFTIASDVIGSLSATLASLSLSFMGTVAADGLLSSTLASLASVATGTVDIAGSANKTLAAIVSSASGTVDIFGNLSRELTGLSLSAGGTVGSLEDFGTLSKTLASLTISGMGSTDVIGTLSKTLASLSISCIGTAEVQGSASKTLAVLTSNAQGTVEIQGAFSLASALITISADGTVEVQGSASKTFASLTVVADGIVGTISSVGDLNQTLAALSNSGVGTVTVSGVLSKTLALLTGNSIGTVAINGDLARTLGALIPTASGIVDIRGLLEKTVGALTLAASGSLDSIVTNGQLDKSLSNLSGVASGAIQVQGVLAKSLTGLSLSGSGAVDISGLLSNTLGALISSGVGDVFVNGSLSITLMGLTLIALNGQITDPVQVYEVGFENRVLQIGYQSLVLEIQAEERKVVALWQTL